MTIDSEVPIETSDGVMSTFITHPEGDGPWPTVLFLMDAPGKREELHDMARRWAGHDYFVMLPHLYYRSTDGFELDFDSDESRKVMTELMMGLSNRMIERDAAAAFAWADEQPLADADNVGCLGYCMSGPFAVWVAASFPDRVKAGASLYGVRLVVEPDTRNDSPHNRLGDIAGELYVATAERDSYAPPEMVDALEAAMAASGVRGSLERYPDTDHGFAFPDRAVYKADAAEHHWEVLVDLFGRNLSAG